MIRFVLCCWAISILFFCGCGPEYIPPDPNYKPPSERKKKPPEEAPVVQPPAPQQPVVQTFATLKLDKTLEFEQCFIRLIHVDNERGSVVQVSNYIVGSTKEKTPSFFIQGRTDARELADLNGQPIMSRVFVKARGSIMSNVGLEPAVLRIKKSEAGNAGSIIGLIQEADELGQIDFTGEFDARVSPR